jgi:hypothetical protein
MFTLPTQMLYSLSAGSAGRWKLWAFMASVLLIATIGTWLAGQYQIGRLDSVKKQYQEPVTNFAATFAECDPHSLERDLLDGCKQSQIGTWLQTTDALRFDGPLTGNRVNVRLDPSQAFLDLNGREIAECVQDEVEERQFDIGSMTNTWAIILFIGSMSLGIWSWICYLSQKKNVQKGRNIYAETLAEANQPSPEAVAEGDTKATGEDDSKSELDQNPPDKTV